MSWTNTWPRSWWRVYLYRAIDQFGQVIDVMVSQKRDLAAARRFFTRALDRRVARGISPPGSHRTGYEEFLITGCMSRARLC
jgi:hypothetical protein